MEARDDGSACSSLDVLATMECGGSRPGPISALTGHLVQAADRPHDFTRSPALAPPKGRCKPTRIVGAGAARSMSGPGQSRAPSLPCLVRRQATRAAFAIVVLFWEEWNVGIVAQPIEALLAGASRGHLAWSSKRADITHVGDGGAQGRAAECGEECQGLHRPLRSRKGRDVRNRTFLDAERYHLSYPFVSGYPMGPTPT